MFLMFESGIRGGISMIPGRYSKANNKYLSSWDPTKECEASTFIQYLDANNLYGWAMSQAMPTGNFRWGTHEDKNTWSNLQDDGNTGALLEFDLEVPPECYDYFKNYPLAPEKLIPKVEDLSQKELILGNKGGTPKVPKLLCTLSLGLKLIKIHRMILFDQSPWLKKYIELNSKLRTNAKNNFEKDFFKLMNDSVFGKQMENLRKRTNLFLCPNDHQYQKQQRRMAGLLFSGRTILD